MSIGSVGSSCCSPYQRPTFDSTDKNGDGALSLDEFSAIGKNVPGGKNGLTGNDIQSLFSAIDADGDGSITKTEAKSAYDKLSSAVQGQLLGVQEQSGQPSGDNSLKAIFDSIDSNKDGSISQDELKASGHHHHHHGGAPPLEATTDSSSTDQTAATSATDPLSAGAGLRSDQRSLSEGGFGLFKPSRHGIGRRRSIAECIERGISERLLFHEKGAAEAAPFLFVGMSRPG